MTTPLFMLRCVQLGISIADLDLLTIGLVNDMFTERQNDDIRIRSWHRRQTLTGSDQTFVLILIAK